MLTEDLRAAIKSSGLTHYRLAKDAEINPTLIDRFMAGERGLNLQTAAKIASVLGLQLSGKSEKSSKKSVSAY